MGCSVASVVERVRMGAVDRVQVVCCRKSAKDWNWVNRGRAVFIGEDMVSAHTGIVEICLVHW
jgi:hypothetical protein